MSSTPTLSSTTANESIRASSGGNTPTATTTEITADHPRTDSMTSSTSRPVPITPTRRSTASSAASTMSAGSSSASTKSSSSFGSALKRRFFGGSRSSRGERESRSSLSISPPAYDEAAKGSTLSSPPSQPPVSSPPRPSPRDDPEATLQELMGKYGFGGSVAAPVIPEFKSKEEKKKAKAPRATASRSPSSPSKTPSPLLQPQEAESRFAYFSTRG